MDWKTGQEVWVVCGTEKQRYAQITCIDGDKAYIDSFHPEYGQRFIVITDTSNNLRVDDRVVNGSYYTNKQAYTESKSLNARWKRFTDAVSRAHLVPEGVTANDIDKCAKLLRLK